MNTERRPAQKYPVHHREEVSRRLRMASGLLLLSFWGGCNWRGEPLSEHCFNTCRTLYQVCNFEKPEQLPKLRKLLEDERSAARLSESETEQLLRILERAEQGEWDVARRKSREFLAAQSR